MKRIPVTQEYVADVMAAQALGETVSHPAEEYFPNALFDGINRMIHKIAHKFTDTIPETEEELFQNCYHHLLRRMEKYDSRRGKFTTFAYWACFNRMRQHHQIVKRRMEHVVCGLDDFEAAGSRELCRCSGDHSRETALRMDVADTVRCLIRDYPESSNLTIGMFGTPEEIEMRGGNTEIRLSVVRGASRKNKEDFYHNTVVPYFKGRFGDYV